MAIIGLMPPDILLVPECDGGGVLPTFRNGDVRVPDLLDVLFKYRILKSSSRSWSQERPPESVAYASYRALMEVKG